MLPLRIKYASRAAAISGGQSEQAWHPGGCASRPLARNPHGRPLSAEAAASAPAVSTTRWSVGSLIEPRHCLIAGLVLLRSRERNEWIT